MGNVGINSVGTKSVYQTGQAGKIECLVGVSRESLTCEILSRHSCIHLVLTLRIPIMCKAYASLHGKLSHEIPVRTLLASFA